MLDLTKKEAGLPKLITVEGLPYLIQTDFSYWLILAQKIEEKSIHSVYDYDFLYVDKKPKNRREGIEKLLTFYNPKNELPHSTGQSDGIQSFDFKLDADLIYSAFYSQYKIDLLNTNLHWHKFLALFNSLENTFFNDVVGYRHFNPTRKYDYKKDMEKRRQAWSLPVKLTEQEQHDLDKFEKAIERSKKKGKK